MRKRYLFYMLLIVSFHSFASMGGLPFESTFETILGIIEKMGRYMIGAGFLVFLIMHNTGARESALKTGIGVTVSGLIVGNLDLILDLIGLTGGAII